LENKKLTNFVIDSNNFKLTLSFEDHYELILEPDLEDDSGLAYWELMMPNEQILTVGPGMFWECKSIHERYESRHPNSDNINILSILKSWIS
jgi:hypothetical protein